MPAILEDLKSASRWTYRTYGHLISSPHLADLRLSECPDVGEAVYSLFGNQRQSSEEPVTDT